MTPRTLRGILRDESGQASVETAFGLAALVSVLILSAGIIGVVTVHLTATDIAGQVARAEARGDSATAQEFSGVLSNRAEIEVVTVDNKILTEVTIALPLFTVRADAVALVEPGAGTDETEMEGW